MPTAKHKDTTDFINKIEQIANLPEDAILVTMHVKYFLTNIQNAEGINTVAKDLEMLKDVDISSRVIIKFLSLTFTLKI